MDRRGTYRLFDASRIEPGDEMLLQSLATHSVETPLVVSELTALSCAVERGFKRITYESQHLALPGGSALYWITVEHARAIGAALARDLVVFRLDFTTAEEGALDALVDALSPSVQVEEFFAAHRSGDEVTIAEARAWSRLVATHHVSSFHLWAAEFDPGSLDALCDDLLAAAPPSLRDVDVCDLTKAEPQDRIPLPRIEALLAANRGH